MTEGKVRKCRVSILVPVYNVQKYLRQCLDSLTDQTMQDIQIICINDGSTDLSLSILEEYTKRDDRIEIVSKANSGYGNTMNRGLALARGEYVGIVESDDFAEKDMFERLYETAKKHDADVVKSNFFAHATVDLPEDDVVVENLSTCAYDQLFCPLDDQRVFLVRPAIWSALYRRSFLEREGIEFLETPGASFQDTSFNFKAFAAASKAVLVKDAFLHYRIDNENSSVKSLSKVFCVCDEYDEIWRFARSRGKIFEALKYRIPQIQLGGFLWNLGRLTPGLQHDFYLRLVEEYRSFDSAGLLKEDFFDDVAWGEIAGILSNPEEYFRVHYGPVNVGRTAILFLTERSKGSCGRIVDGLLKLLGQDEELYVSFDDSVVNPEEASKRIAETDPRVRIAEGQVSSSVVHEINMAEIRGSQLLAVHAGGPDYSTKSIPSLLESVATMKDLNSPRFSGSWAVGAWDSEDLKRIGRPIWLPLLLAGFYHDKTGGFENLPNWILTEDLSLKEPTLSDVRIAFDSLEALYDLAINEREQGFYGVRKKAFTLFNNLWIRVQRSYDCLKYDDRLAFGKRPSPLRFSPLVYEGGESVKAGDVDLSVIVPVYNVERYLRECLDSVLEQDVPAMEVICVNDASSDASLEILEEYAGLDSRIRVVSQFNGGAGSARNRGIELSVGKYLAFIDPDDFFPEKTTLSKMLSSAETHQALICGGSFEMQYPDGSKTKFFGGERFFYTHRSEGFRSFSSDETDYGWIRFLYHRSLFDDGGVRFPEYRWYEDPVFLVRAMAYCDDYYALKDVVYTYRVEHKKPSWNVVKVRDMVKGIEKNLSYAKERRLTTLYTTLIHRLNRDYYEPIMEFISDEEVFTRLVSIQGALDPSLVNDSVESGWNSYLIKPLLDMKNGSDTAVVRLAKRAQKTNFYKKLQLLRMKRRKRTAIV